MPPYASTATTWAVTPIGRTVLTLDVTPYLSTANTLEVTAEHPEMIADMPWVCGGCSSEWGFSEGSQPFGIFRPVELEVTDEVRIEPFGVHIWHDDEVKTVYIDTELKNYSAQPQTFQLVSRPEQCRRHTGASPDGGGHPRSRGDEDRPSGVADRQPQALEPPIHLIYIASPASSSEVTRRRTRCRLPSGFAH